MSVRSDLEQISDNASRALALLQKRQQAKTDDENPDVALDVTPAMRQVWTARFDALVASIKSLAAGLP